MRPTHSTWISPAACFAACLLVSCGLGGKANLGDDSAPPQGESDGGDGGSSSTPISCGDNVCGSDEYCCNESCGACVKAGETCDLAACVPEAYEPCAGKVCGDPCALCAPDDRDCSETADVKTCDTDGQCHSGNSACETECWTPTLDNFCGQFACPAPGERPQPGLEDAIEFFKSSGICDNFSVTLVSDSCGRDTIGYSVLGGSLSYEFITGTLAAATIASDASFGPCNELSYYSTSDGSGTHLEGCEAWTRCEVCGPPGDPDYPECRFDCDCDAVDPGVDPCFAPDSCECYCQQIAVSGD